MNEKTRRKKRCRIEATPEAITGQADRAKALVMTHVGRLVADGHAEWNMRKNGDVRLRLHTGETFLLAETMIIRIA